MKNTEKHKNLASKEYWDAGYRDFKFFAMPKNYPICKMIYKHFPATNNKAIFEIGIFPGRFIYHFGRLGYEINGVDQTPFLNEMINWFKGENFKTGYFDGGDLLKMNTDKKYDVVFSSGFIEHFENFPEIIKIHADLTKQGGMIYITAPNFAGSIQKFLHKTFDRESFDKHNLLAMDVKRWEEILTQEGFEIIESGYFGGFDFWISSQNKNIFKKILGKILSKITLRFIPNMRIYSPEIILIAKKK
jgi:SAM-dependent methyltransferase